MRMRIFIVENTAVNVDNDADATALLERGARELSPEEIAAAGMTGHEHLVGPDNSTVAADGTVTFFPPAPPSSEMLFARLRWERDRRIAATDYLIMPDYPLPEDSRAAVQVYRQALRDLPTKEGAPWDGGGEATPWPALPAVQRLQLPPEMRE